MIATANMAFGLVTSAARNRLRMTLRNKVWRGRPGLSATSCDKCRLPPWPGLLGSIRNARIEPHIDEIDQQIGDDEDQRADDDHRLHDRIVAAEHRLHGQEADAGPGED